MKKLLTFVLSLAIMQIAVGQHETLFDDMDAIGAFGGPIVEISSINGQVGADVGGGGAIILDGFFIGGYGMGTDFPDYTIPKDNEFEGLYNIKYKHGGLWFGYAGNMNRLLHGFGSLKLGWGKAQLLQDKEKVFTDRHFTLTPELGVEVNLTSFFKLALTGGYRWVNGVTSLPGLDDSDFNSFTGTLTFRFGGFMEEWDDWDD